MAYATVADVQARMLRQMSASEQTICATWLEDAARRIDKYNSNADEDDKKVVSCRMVIRQLGDGEASGIPIGATQGSMSGLGYAQSWTVGSGTTGEMYLSKEDRQLLGGGNKIGSYSPVEEMATVVSI